MSSICAIRPVLCRFVLFVLWPVVMNVAVLAGEPGTIDIGDRRELFVDRLLLDRQDGVELRLHAPIPRDVVLVCDAPWEGSGCGYETLFRDGPIIRMYYIAADLTNADGTRMASRPDFVCYAESRDGLHWTKPELGLFEFQGSKRNNIVWSAPSLDNFTPFKDANPDCRPGEQYKAVSSGTGGLWAYKSADGFHWAPLAGQADHHQGGLRHPEQRLLGPARQTLLVLHPRLPQGHPRHPRRHVGGFPYLDGARVAAFPRRTRRAALYQPGPAVLPRGTCSWVSPRAISNGRGRLP